MLPAIVAVGGLVGRFFASQALRRGLERYALGLATGGTVYAVTEQDRAQTRDMLKDANAQNKALSERLDALTDGLHQQANGFKRLDDLAARQERQGRDHNKLAEKVQAGNRQNHDDIANLANQFHRANIGRDADPKCSPSASPILGPTVAGTSPSPSPQ